MPGIAFSFFIQIIFFLRTLMPEKKWIVCSVFLKKLQAFFLWFCISVRIFLLQVNILSICNCMLITSLMICML